MSLSRNLDMSTSSRNKISNQGLAAHPSKALEPSMFKHVMSWNHCKFGKQSAIQLGLFLLKLTSLEVVRRISKARCPVIWQAIQGLQLLCYFPFQFLRKWKPFNYLIEGSQKLSRPMLFISIATVFMDQPAFMDQPDVHIEPSNNMEPLTLMPVETSDALVRPPTSVPEENRQIVESESWLQKLKEELREHGIAIPERIDDDEMKRFYVAANNDPLCFLSSIKKTIKWRETYYILSKVELEAWTHLVFWHGFDVKLRPCLFIRLGLACLSLKTSERPRFAQAVVSQVEYGVLNLVNGEDPRITVVMDCEGLSAIRFPMQMMKSCASLMQDHYPNRLTSLFVIKLPPVVRVLAQTFIQILRPLTRQKLHMEGNKYMRILSEHIESIPAPLGGQCECSVCLLLAGVHTRQGPMLSRNNTLLGESADDDNDNDEVMSCSRVVEMSYDGHCDRILRTTIFSILMLWIFVALIIGMNDFGELMLS